MRKVCLVAAALALAAAVGADEVGLDKYLEEFEGLLKDILQINIKARVVDAKEQPVWEARKRMFTVPGLEVEVRVPSESLVVRAYFTPVRLTGDRLLIQVYAELWSATEPESTSRPRYTTTVSYVPAELGEKIRFYPLGEFPTLGPGKTNDKGSFNLELEIQIVPYGSE